MKRDTAIMNLAQVRSFALSLPQVSEQPHFDRTSFRVAGKIFLTALPEDTFINVMVGDAAREPMLAQHPDCLDKLFWGQKVLGLRVDLSCAAQWLVEELVKTAWEEKAPASLRGS